ncbi:unnamed protein product [Acanthoscelides obtectus]|uniref:Protein sleepless n=1 Tax=Acanthoscelides obtectus TaxID=200917 RepID=A0A9P0NYC0_ACAOB|nr:unnamed protein product [Acanthoscelides obtectus]CAK1658452.1 hypothetical protein AOBTE_LOCUS20904 [Acanthoscelides obtectus]
MLLFAVAVLCLDLRIVNSLKCYECTISDGPACEHVLTSGNISSTNCELSVFNVDFTQSRGGENIRCLKTIERNQTHTFYTRRCAFKSEGNICDTKTYKDTELLECHLCQTDLCNSGTMLSVPVIVILILFIFSL